jgi:hypothetical protein
MEEEAESKEESEEESEESEEESEEEAEAAEEAADAAAEEAADAAPEAAAEAAAAEAAEAANCSDRTCSICFAELKDYPKNPENKRIILTCGAPSGKHCFHLHCIRDVIKSETNPKCPLCRVPIPEDTLSETQRLSPKERRERERQERERRKQAARDAREQAERVARDQAELYAREQAELDRRTQNRQEHERRVQDKVKLRREQEPEFASSQHKDRRYLIDLYKEYLEPYDTFNRNYSSELNRSIKEELKYSASIETAIKKYPKEKLMAYLKNWTTKIKMKYKTYVHDARVWYKKIGRTPFIRIFDESKSKIYEGVSKIKKKSNDSAGNLSGDILKIINSFFINLMRLHFFIINLFYFYIQEIIDYDIHIHFTSQGFLPIKKKNDLNKIDKEEAFYESFKLIDKLIEISNMLLDLLQELRSIEPNLTTSNPTEAMNVDDEKNLDNLEDMAKRTLNDMEEIKWRLRKFEHYMLQYAGNILNQFGYFFYTKPQPIMSHPHKFFQNNVSFDKFVFLLQIAPMENGIPETHTTTLNVYFLVREIVDLLKEAVENTNPEEEAAAANTGIDTAAETTDVRDLVNTGDSRDAALIAGGKRTNRRTTRRPTRRVKKQSTRRVKKQSTRRVKKQSTRRVKKQSTRRVKKQSTRRVKKQSTRRVKKTI